LKRQESKFWRHKGELLQRKKKAFEAQDASSLDVFKPDFGVSPQNPCIYGAHRDGIER